MSDAADLWLADLERRHLSDLTPTEVARALRALSSCYVERRNRLAAGDALGSKGKRAAFALFYGPLHFVVVREVARALSESSVGLREIVDLGCGTGAAGLAWAHVSGAAKIRGFDRSQWAIDEANAAYRLWRIDGRATRRDIASRPSQPLRVATGAGVLAAYTVNELDEAARDALLAVLLSARRSGARVLVVEPISRRLSPWWPAWAAAFTSAGGRADEWRFSSALWPTQQQLARASGLDPRELTARSLFA
jgi:hypothetical protein